MALAIEKARKVGVGVVTMSGGGDAGRLGYYAGLAVAQNMIGIVASAQGLRAVPVFGSEPWLGTNPIAIAAPSKSEVPLIFDTTTASAFGWLRNAYRDGVPFPGGTIAVLDGTPAMAQVPSGPLGNYYLPPLGGDRQHGAQRGYGCECWIAMLFAALNVAAFADPDVFLHNKDEGFKALRTTPPARHHDRYSIRDCTGMRSN
jgi:L-2-hydroxycarboxylate dehydrogenase (NAD+)